MNEAVSYVIRGEPLYGVLGALLALYVLTALLLLFFVPWRYGRPRQIVSGREMTVGAPYDH